MTGETAGYRLTYEMCGRQIDDDPDCIRKKGHEGDCDGNG